VSKLENIEAKDVWTPEELNIIIGALLSQSEKEGIVFVYGKGKRKTLIQRAYDNLTKYRVTLEECLTRIQICGEDRNSYSKTDHDATMMHMKEDYYMKTGIFKPGYNVQIGVCDEYISYACVFQDRSDQKTLIKFMERYRALYDIYPEKLVADAGYGSYDNYMYCLTHKMEAYIKYTMYSKEKEKKYKKNLYSKANWMKDESGRYICPAGHAFTCTSESVDKRSKYLRINQSHSCGKCKNCEQKSACTTAKENRIITVNPILNELQLEAKKRLDSEEGIQLRMKRSIETEGAFGVIKTDNKYDRIHRRSIKSVEMEVQLVSIGFNLMKYHNKKQRPKQLA
ncbi:MAG: transposase, partial [Longicatena sp.]